MAVEVTPLNVLGGGKQPVTQVTDTFGRGTLNPSGSFVWQNNVFNTVPLVNNMSFGHGFCNGGNQIVLSGIPNGVISTYFSTILPCVGLTFGSVNGQTQFVQATFQSILNAAGVAAGLMVMGSWNGEDGGSWYGLNFSQTGTPFLERCIMSGGVLTTTTLFTAPAGQVAGDIWRLSFNVATSVPTLTKNSVVLYNTADGSPLAGGLPGFQMRTVLTTGGTSNQIVMSNLSCGLGL